MQIIAEIRCEALNLHGLLHSRHQPYQLNRSVETINQEEIKNADHQSNSSLILSYCPGFLQCFYKNQHQLNVAGHFKPSLALGHRSNKL